jgi:hypothetical protein
LLVNGDFAVGLAPWTTFGTITSQIAGGVFEFIRPIGTPPAGVVFQATGQSMTAGQILTATFVLGNSSPVRKRVTAILHDNNFSDLAACTFWLPAGQVLSPYSLRAYTTQAWADATFSVYAATVGADQWIQLDDATLKRTPGAAIAGTECIEPAAPVALPARTAISRIARPEAPSTGSVDPARTKLGRVEAVTAPTLLASDTIDLAQATSAQLTLDSWLASDGAWGEIQMSIDGSHWISVAIVRPSDDWTSVDVDLSEWLGHTVRVRFLRVAPRADSNSGDVWYLRHVRVKVDRQPSPPR